MASVLPKTALLFPLLVSVAAAAVDNTLILEFGPNGRGSEENWNSNEEPPPPPAIFGGAGRQRAPAHGDGARSFDVATHVREVGLEIGEGSGGGDLWRPGDLRNPLDRVSAEAEESERTNLSAGITEPSGLDRSSAEFRPDQPKSKSFGLPAAKSSELHSTTQIPTEIDLPTSTGFTPINSTNAEFDPEDVHWVWSPERRAQIKELVIQMERIFTDRLENLNERINRLENHHASVHHLMASDWRPLGVQSTGKRVRVFAAKSTWRNAEEVCVAHGGRLLIVESEVESLRITEYLQNHDQNLYWIGSREAVRAAERQGFEDDQCAALSPAGKWTRHDCSETHGFICQF